MNGRRIFADFLVTARGYFRNSAALFFSLIFPIILILLFGLIFSSTGNTAVPLYVQNFDHSSPTSISFLDALNNTSFVTVQVIPTSYNLSTYLGQNGDPVGLVIPAGFAANYAAAKPVNVTLITDSLDASSSGIAAGAVSGVVSSFNLDRACAPGSACYPVIGVQTGQVGSAVFKYIDYLVPGLIGFSILTSPMFAMVEVTATYRKEGIFRQLSLTPISRAEWLSSRILWYVVLSFFAAALMIGVGTYGFGAHVTLTLGLVPFLLIGPFFFVALGMLAGSAAKTIESAAVIGNIITFPMMFLSGTFFPVSSFPPYLQTFAHILPLYYVIDGLNQVMLFHNSGRALTDFLILVVISVIVFVLAVLTFRWRDE
ncbi:MAG: ABC transporter permease [Thermoplasmata archaeon]|jgi:ABC-2 type transport system permease protein